MASKLDAMALLKSLDKDDLAKQIEEAKKRVEEATAELRALQSMNKIRMIRAGELKRKTPQKKAKKAASADAAPVPLKSRIISYLEVAGASRPDTVAIALDASPVEVGRILEGDSSMFIKTPVAGGRHGFALR